MILRCYCIGNQLSESDQLIRYITQNPDVELISIETDARKALSELLSGNVVTDIVFMDINIPHISGLELAARVEDLCKVIFTTRSPLHALQAYDVNAVDYLLEPFTYLRFVQAIQKVKRLVELKMGRSSITAATDVILMPGDGNGNFVKIAPEDILYIKAASNYLNIVMLDRMIMSYCGLKTILKYLPQDLFIRTHKSYIINISHIIKGCATSVILSNKEFVPIARTYKNALLKLIIRK